MQVEIGTLIGIFAAIGGFVLGYFNFRRQSDKEIKADSGASGELRADINYIRRGVEDIRIDMKAQEKRHSELTERVTRVEESTKQAHHRINELKVQFKEE